MHYQDSLSCKLPPCQCEMLPTLTWSKSGWMIPLLGDAFLTSAMRPGFPVRVCAACSAPMKSRDFGAAPTRAISWGRETLCLHLSTSTALNLRQQPERLSAQAERPHSQNDDLVAVHLGQQLDAVTRTAGLGRCMPRPHLWTSTALSL